MRKRPIPTVLVRVGFFYELNRPLDLLIGNILARHDRAKFIRLERAQDRQRDHARLQIAAESLARQAFVAEKVKQIVRDLKRQPETRSVARQHFRTSAIQAAGDCSQSTATRQKNRRLQLNALVIFGKRRNLKQRPILFDLADAKIFDQLRQHRRNFVAVTSVCHELKCFCEEIIADQHGDLCSVFCICRRNAAPNL